MKATSRCLVYPLIAMALLSSAIAPDAGAQSAAPADRRAASPPARMSEAQAIAELKAELDKLTAADQFSGAVLVAKAGRPVFQQAYGYANLEKKIPNTVETRFIYGSMAKMFTGVSVMQLVQAGKMKVDDPISKYLPDYPNKEVAAATIHQLLTHTGGTGDIFGPQFDAHSDELKEHEDYVALYGERGPRFAPGSKHEYSNYGMVLLGRIVEVVSGQNYFDYVRDHIFEPAGMKSTDARLVDQRVAGLAIPYTRLAPGEPLRLGPNAEPKTGPLRARTDMRNSGTAAGGGYSTVGDFLKFATALTSNRLLDARHTQLVTTGKVQGGGGRGNAKYAYGFSDIVTPDGVRRIGHNGGAEGLNGDLAIFPDSRYVVVALANRDPMIAGTIVNFIQRRLPLRERH